MKTGDSDDSAQSATTHWDKRLDDIEARIAEHAIPTKSWEVITDILDSTRIVASYIHGANEAFAELTRCTSRARHSMRATRLAPRSIVTSNVSYMNTVYESVKDPNDNNQSHVQNYMRLIAVNSPEKQRDVVDLIMHCYGAPMTVYLTTAVYGFELLLADSQESFIMFSDEHDAIDSTLYLRGGDLTRELEHVFDKMCDNTVEVIDCSTIDEGNVADALARVKKVWADVLLV